MTSSDTIPLEKALHEIGLVLLRTSAQAPPVANDLGAALAPVAAKTEPEDKKVIATKLIEEAKLYWQVQLGALGVLSLLGSAFKDQSFIVPSAVFALALLLAASAYNFLGTYFIFKASYSLDNKFQSSFFMLPMLFGIHTTLVACIGAVIANGIYFWIYPAVEKDPVPKVLLLDWWAGGASLAVFLHVVISNRVFDHLEKLNELNFVNKEEREQKAAKETFNASWKSIRHMTSLTFVTLPLVVAWVLCFVTFIGYPPNALLAVLMVIPFLVWIVAWMVGVFEPGAFG